jgi:hypothetical protein
LNADKDYSVVKNIDLVLFALYKCGGAEHLVHTEDVADRVFKYPLGKHRYRWERYLYPDKERGNSLVLFWIYISIVRRVIVARLRRVIKKCGLSGGSVLGE